MITHTVAFTLKPNEDLADFLRCANELAAIEGVGNFRVLRQISVKNSFTHALSMEFASQAQYDHYNDHPEHQHFVNTIWLRQVEDFLELDYVLEQSTSSQ